MRKAHISVTFQKDWDVFGEDQFDWKILEITDNLLREGTHAIQYRPKTYSKIHRQEKRIYNPALSATRIKISFKDKEFSSQKHMSIMLNRKSGFVAQIRYLSPEITYEEIWEKYGPKE